MVIVAFDAHNPVVGVNVYVLVPAVLVLIGADQVPVMPLFEVEDRIGAVLFWHKGLTAVKAGVAGVRHVIAKLLFEISKNVPAIDITMTRAVVVDAFGTVIACEPSFGVLADNTMG